MNQKSPESIETQIGLKTLKLICLHDQFFRRRGASIFLILFLQNQQLEIYLLAKLPLLQVNLCQNHLFISQLTQNIAYRC